MRTPLLHILLLFLSLTFLSHFVDSALTRTYQNCRIISAGLGFKMYWTVSGSKILMGTESTATGWSAIGLSLNGDMGGGTRGFADAWITSSDGIYDFWTEGNGRSPKKDKKNDLGKIALSFTGGKIYSEWDRNLDTSDTNNEDYVITPGTPQMVFWGLGSAPASFDNYNSHGANKGNVEVDFGKSSTCDPPKIPGQFISPSGFEATWAVSTDKTEITFTMKYQTTGWIAIGLSAQPFMSGADMYIGYVSGTTVTLYDGTASGQSNPPVRSPSNIIATSVTGSVTGGVTTISFTRKIVVSTGYKIIDGTSALLVAWGANGQTGTPGSLSKHSSKDSTYVNFLSSGNSSVVPPPPPPPSGGGFVVPRNDALDPVGPTITSIDNTFSLAYQIVGSSITFKMTANTVGWLSMALAKSSAMINSDSYTGWIYDDGSLFFEDGYISAKAQPDKDPIQNFELLSAYKINGKTSITFRRPLNTNDPKDYVVDSSILKVLYAWHPSPGVSISSSSVVLSQHSTKGSIDVDFFPPPPANNTNSTTVVTEWVDTRRGSKLSWKVNGSSISFVLTINAVGWIAVGFGNGKVQTMADLDIYIGWVDGVGPNLRDCKSIDTRKPEPDNKQDGVLLGGSQDGTSTTISFSRLLKTGDADDKDIIDGEMLVVLAYGSDIPISNKRATQALNYNYHKDRFSKLINLLSTTPVIPSPPPPGGSVINGTVNDTKPKNNNFGVSEKGDFKLTYEEDKITNTFTFFMSAHTRGWISIGFNKKNKLMYPADTYTGYLIDGEIFMKDEYSEAKVRPKKDLIQNFEVLAAEETEWTSIVWRRPSEASDSYDVAVKDAKFVIWAYCDEDGDENGYKQHIAYGSLPVNFNLENAFAVAPTIQLPPGPILLLIVLAIMLLWALIRLVIIIIKRASYSEYKFDQPAATYTNVQELLEKVEEDELDPEKDVELPENAPRNPSGVEFNAGHYQGNTYVKFTPDERAGGVSLKTSADLKNVCKGLLDYRFHGTHVTIGDIISFSLYIVFTVISYFINDAYDPFSVSGAVPSLGSLIGANSVMVVMFATRHSALVYLLGIPFDRAILFHRWLGRWNGILIALHFILHSANQAIIDPSGVAKSWIEGADNVNVTGTATLNLYGLLGGIVFIIIFVFSLEWFRRNQFEIFLLSHILVILFFMFGYFHTPEFRVFGYIAAALFGLDIILRLVLSSIIIPRKTTVFKKRSESLVQVRFPKQSPWAKPFFRPGQYIFVNVPAISRVEWHPFSVSSSPDDNEIEVNIRALGNWTKKLAALAGQTNEVWIRADGPYGNLNLNYHRYTNLVLVAGGIGITPVLGIIKDIFTSKKKRRSRLENVIMVWSVPGADEGSWFMEDFNHLMNLAQHSSIKLDLRIHVTRAAKDAPVPAPPMFNGRPNMEKIMDQSSSKTVPCFVFVCGPRKMVNSTWDLATSLQRAGKICHFHHETFEF